MKTPRARLTWLYTITTGAILLLVITAFLPYTVRDRKKSQLEQFQVIWNSLSSRFMASGALTHQYLAQTEADHQLVIHNGKRRPLFVPRVLEAGHGPPDSHPKGQG